MVSLKERVEKYVFTLDNSILPESPTVFLPTDAEQ